MRLNLVSVWVSSKVETAKLVHVFTAFYARYYTGWTPEQFRHEIVKNVYVMIYIFAARFVLDYVAVVWLMTLYKIFKLTILQLGFRHTGLRISAAIRLKYLKSSMALPVSSIDAVPQGHIAALITITANQVQDGISEKLCILIQNVSLVVSAIVVGFVYSWLLAVVTMGGFVFVLLVYSLTLYPLVKKWNKVQDADREGAGSASETISSIRMVTACGAEGKMAERYAEWVKSSTQYGQQMSKWIALQSSLVFFAIYALVLFPQSSVWKN